MKQNHPTKSTTVVDKDTYDNYTNNSEKDIHFSYTVEEKKLLRKINITTLPFIFSIILFQYIDKTALNFSVVLGLFEDTKITGSEFSWLGSIFYLGYLAFQIPNQYFIQRFSLSKYLGVCLVLWGTILVCTALAKNFSQLLVLRFFQGFFEAAVYPAIQLLFSTIYRRREQVICFAMLVSTNNLGTVVGSLIGFGFINLHGIHGLSGWKWCMIILGSLTILLGITTFLFFPDRPTSKWYRITPDEIFIVEERLSDNCVIPNKTIKLDHIWESLKDPRLYCYFFISLFLNMVNGCIGVFSTTIIKSMNFSNVLSMLLNIPLGFMGIALTVIAGYFNRHFNENGYIAALSSITCFTGILLLTVLSIGGIQLIGLYLSHIAPAYAITITMISNNVSGYTKKIFYNAVFLVGYCCGNFIGPLMIRPEEAPRYTTGMIGYLCGLIITTVLFLYLRWSYARDNRYRLQLKAGINNTPPSTAENDAKDQHVILEKEDLTDQQNLHFLYRP
ncbi:hypothetical protein INT45_014261 [Circinella minor]|uniref:Major facilitator superfamily (MFS) profile domain-containing protein n=1 Tax=Circinella minor TaxID=1195481 RepID=A0A8H7SBZ4_9FUNG|nr:hypothetical protein INT45_014261 [Circinella minor]